MRRIPFATRALIRPRAYMSPRSRVARRFAIATLLVLTVSAVVLVPARRPPVKIAASDAERGPLCNPPPPVIAPVRVDNLRASFMSSERAVPQNIFPDPDFLGSCRTAVITTAHVSEEIAAINNARYSEGVTPITVNAARFAHLTGAEQVLVVTDLERVARHLTPVAALTSQLDLEAAHGTALSQDPVFAGWTLVGGKSVTAWASNWAGGLDVLGSDYIFMYDDGVGYNIDCPSAGASGCWAHRDNVLFATPAASSCTGLGGRAELLMGAAVLPATYQGRVGVGELFVMSCGGLPRDTAFTWRTAQHDLVAPKAK